MFGGEFIAGIITGILVPAIITASGVMNAWMYNGIVGIIISAAAIVSTYVLGETKDKIIE